MWRCPARLSLRLIVVQPTTNYAGIAVLTGLVLVLVMAFLCVIIWVWAVRRPPVSAAGATSTEEATLQVQRPLTFVAIGNADVNTLFGGKEGSTQSGWAGLLHRHMPDGALFSQLGEHDHTLSETIAKAIPEAARINPDIVTLWNVVGDSTGGTSLTSYLGELRKALDMLTRETEAQIVLLNMPDITLRLQNQAEERRALVRGGIQQWNRVIAEVASRYGRRVLIADLFPLSEQVLNPETGNGTLADTIWADLEASKVQ